MIGDSSKEGVIYLLLSDLFNQAGNCPNSRVEFRVGMVEIYNETIRDLLNDTMKSLDVLEDSHSDTVIKGLTEFKVASFGAIQALIQKGKNNLMVACTSNNYISSRSHCVI